MNISPRIFWRELSFFFHSGMAAKIFCMAIGVWIVVWFGVFSWLIFSSKTVDLDLMPNTQYPTHGSDSEHYTVLAENLQNQGFFSLSTEEPFLPDGFRTIGYPLFLASIKIIFQTYYIAVIAQMFMVLGSGYLVYRLAKELGLDKWSIVPAVIVIFDPASFFYSLFLLSDTVFNFLLLLCSWFFLKGIKKDKTKECIVNFSISGSILGLAVLVRPIAIFLPSVFIFTSLVSRRPFLIKNFLQEIGVFLGCVLVLISPWLIRNHLVFNTWQLSSVGPVTFFAFTVPEFIEQSGGPTIAETRARFHKEINMVTDDLVIDMAKTPEMMRIVKRELDGRLGKYVWFHVEKTLPFFYTSSAKIFIVGVEPFRSNEILWQMTSYPSKSSLSIQSRAEIRVLLAQAFFLVERLLWLLFFSIALISPFLVKTAEKRIIAFICCAFITYFALLTGPVANERYRLPAIPFAALSLALVLSTYIRPGPKLD